MRRRCLRTLRKQIAVILVRNPLHCVGRHFVRQQVARSMAPLVEGMDQYRTPGRGASGRAYAACNCAHKSSCRGECSAIERRSTSDAVLSEAGR